MPQVKKCNEVHYVFHEGEDSAISSAPWTLQQGSSGPMTKACNSFVQFSSRNHPAFNKWSWFSQTKPVIIPSGGPLIIFRLHISEASGSEVKQNTSGDLILRLTF